MSCIQNGYSFWDSLKIIFKSGIKLSRFLKIHFKWALDQIKGNLSVKHKWNQQVKTSTNDNKYRYGTNNYISYAFGRWFSAKQLALYLQ